MTHNLRVTDQTPPFRPSDFGIGRLFSAVTDAVIVGDVEKGTIVLWNPAAEALFGYPAADVIGRPLSTIVAESLRAQHDAGLARYRTYRQGRIVGRARAVEVLARASDGREFPVELTLSRMEGDDTHLLAIVRDISDRQAVRSALELEQQRREFFGTAAHELRTPLTAVSAYLQLAEKYLRRGRTDEAVEALSSGRRRVDQMARLIEDLLSVSRIDAGRLTMRLSRIDLCDSLRLGLGHYEDSRELLRIDAGTVPVIVDADPERLQQVLDNLVTNALKYGERKPVDVTLSTHHGLAVVEVCDRGLGVPEADQAQLFMAFFRTSNTQNLSGTGLGLFISQRIAELHGGRLILRSSGPDGSVFALELPLAAETA